MQKRLLFVDDEEKIRATLPVILRRYGFTVTCAASVGEAVVQIKANEFDLLLCDLNIERQADGYEVVRAMRQRNPHCVVIVLTGYPSVETAVEGIHETIDDYIAKPSNPDHLVALLAERLAARQPKARILSVSYDEVLLNTRAMLLERERFEVVSALGFDSALEECRQGGFDVLLLGPSISDSDKQKLAEEFRRSCPAPIIVMRRSIAEHPTPGADLHIDADPESLLEAVVQIVRKKSAKRANAQSSPSLQ